MALQFDPGINTVTKQFGGSSQTVGVILSFNNTGTLPANAYNPPRNSMELMISLPVSGSSPIAAEIKPFLDLDTVAVSKTGTVADMITNCGGTASLKTVVNWYAQNVLGVAAGGKTGVDFVTYRLDTNYRYDTTTTGKWKCLAWDNIQNASPENSAFQCTKTGTKAGVVLGSLRKDTLSAAGWSLQEFEEIYFTATASGTWPYLPFPLPAPATASDLTFASYSPGTGWANATKALAPAATQMGLGAAKDITQMIHGGVVAAELTDSQLGAAQWPLWTAGQHPSTGQCCRRVRPTAV